MNLSRLRQMSGSEIGHRVRERFRRNIDQSRVRMGMIADGDPELESLIVKHGSSLKTYFERGPARRFYASVQDRDGLSNFISRHFPQWLEASVCDADCLREHDLTLLGHGEVSLGTPIDWHRDPISGYQWPRRFWAQYELLNTPHADAKIIHELNRHQHLPRLAKAFFLTADESCAREAVAQIESWIDQNPKWTGINWQSSLEIGIRTISWLWTIFLILESNSLDEPRLRRIVKSLFGQLDQIYRYPSTYSSPNTHLIGEAAALFVAGLLFQELPRAEKWREFGMKTLVEAMDQQVSADGVYCELSSYYHCYAADFYLHVLVLAKRNSLTFPERTWLRLEKMLDFVMHVTRGDGTIPLLGDDDGGRVLALGLQDYRSYSDGLCSGAVLFGRGDFKAQAGGFYEEALWLLGDDAWPIFNSLEPHHPVDHCKIYREGYYVQRSGWGPQDTQILLDCGGLGLPTGGHGHADALSFNLFSGGREFLIDPGTSVYNCAPEWREYFRSTQAHNSVLVDGASQSETNGTFAWKRKAVVTVRQQFLIPEISYIDAEHDGYARKTHGVTHRRRLVQLPSRYSIVLDELSGRGEHSFDFLYHFAPDVRLTIFGEEKSGEIDCRARAGDAGLQLLLYASDSLRAAVQCGQQRPIQGWSSQRYGQRLPSSVLRTSMQGVPPVSMMTFLVPGKEPAQSRRMKSNSSHTIAAVIRDGEFDDVAVMAVVDGELHLLDCVMQGEFFWLRMQNGNLCRLLAVNARCFRYGGETVFESPYAVPYVQAYFWDDGIVIEHGTNNEGKVYVRDLRDRQFQRN